MSVPGAAAPGSHSTRPTPELGGQVATVATEETTPGVVRLSGRVMVTLSPTATLRSVARRPAPPAPGEWSRWPASPSRRAGRWPPSCADTVVTRTAAGSNTAWPRASVPFRVTPRAAWSFSTAAVVAGPNDGGLRTELSPGGIAERDQIRVELGHVGAGRPSRQGPIGRSRAVQQHHRAVVHPVEHLTLRDHLRRPRAARVCPAGLVDHGVRRAVRARPIGQDPALGDHRRERPPLHLRGVRRRLRCGPGLLLRAGHDEQAAGDDHGSQDARCGQHPRLPPHRVTPAAAPRPRHFCIAAWRMLSPPGALADGIRFVSTRGWPLTGSGKSFTPFSRMHCGELEGPRLLRGAPLAAREPRRLQVLARAHGLLERRGARVQRRAVRYLIDGELARRARVRELG